MPLLACTCPEARVQPPTMSNGCSVWSDPRYSASPRSSTSSDTSGCVVMHAAPPALPPSWARYSVARSRTCTWRQQG